MPLIKAFNLPKNVVEMTANKNRSLCFRECLKKLKDDPKYLVEALSARIERGEEQDEVISTSVSMSMGETDHLDQIAKVVGMSPIQVLRIVFEHYARTN